MSFSCDETDDLFDIKTDMAFSEVLQLNSNGSAASAQIAVTETINPSDLSSFASLQSRVKDIEIEKITYEINSLEEGHNPDASVTIDLSYSVNGSSNNSLETISAALNNVGTETEINVTAEDISTISNTLKAGESIDIFALGNLENGPVNIEITFTIYTKVTAAP